MRHNFTDSSPTELRDSYDVIVVGARVAGAATAFLLARYGFDVLLLDRSRYGTDTLSTHALMRAGVAQLHRWGLLDRIIEAGTPPVHRTTFTYGDEVVPVEIKPSHGVDALYAPRRTLLDPILVDAATEAGAYVSFCTTVNDLMRGRDGRVSGVVARSQNSDPTEIRSGLVVGADGMNSTIARRVGAKVERTGTASSTFTYAYWNGVETPGYEWNFVPSAASGAIPTNNGDTCVFAALPHRPRGRISTEEFIGFVARSSPDLADRLRKHTPTSRVRVFEGPPGHMRTAQGPGWALVGDAGYYKDPLSSHGITDALRDAELLTLAIVATLRDGTPERKALHTYQARRDLISTDLFDVTDTLATFAWDSSHIPERLLQLSAAMGAELETIDTLPPVPALRPNTWQVVYV